VSQLGVKRLILFDHSEFNLYRLERELNDSDLDFESVLGSVMDRDLLSSASSRCNG